MHAPSIPDSRRRRRSALLVSLVALACLTAGPSRAADRPSIVLIPIVVHSAESPEYLQQGLSDMLASRFEQAGAFEVLHVDESTGPVIRLDQALEVGRALNADFVLFGSFTRFGVGASLDAQAAATQAGADGEVLREIFVHSGSIGEVIPDLDVLVGKVKRFAIADFGATPPPAEVGTGAGEKAKGGLSSASPHVADLERRVDALEAEVRALREASSGSE